MENLTNLRLWDEDNFRLAYTTDDNEFKMLEVREKESGQLLWARLYPVSIRKVTFSCRNNKMIVVFGDLIEICNANDGTVLWSKFNLVNVHNVSFSDLEGAKIKIETIIKIDKN